MKDIEKKLNNLPKEERTKFSILLIDCLYDRDWCENNNINYLNPNISKAKKELYSQMFDIRK